MCYNFEGRFYSTNLVLIKQMSLEIKKRIKKA